MSHTYNFRLESITFKDFMCVPYGRITVSDATRDYIIDEDYWKSDIIGLYGPNGSGKTTVYKGLKLLLDILNCRSIENYQLIFQKDNEKDAADYANSVRSGCQSARLEFGFRICEDDKPTDFQLFYSFEFERKTASGASIDDPEKEVLYIQDEDYLLIEAEKTRKLHFSLAKIRKDARNLKKFVKDAYKCEEETEEFSEIYRKFFRLLKTAETDRSFLMQAEKSELSQHKAAGMTIFSIFRAQLAHNLILIGDLQTSRLRGACLTMLFRTGSSENAIYFISETDGSLSSLGNTDLAEYLPDISEDIKRLNTVVDALLPGTSLGLVNDGDEIKAIIRKEGGEVIPYDKESYGTRKLIMLASYIRKLFEGNYYILFIDELDEGIFEYLLGALLSTIQNRAHGQLIFTAHNLRPLECLEHSSIRFAVPCSQEENGKQQNQYQEIKRLTRKNNLREIYLQKLKKAADTEE